jgi:ferredoxin--NADP+ reductase
VSEDRWTRAKVTDRIDWADDLFTLCTDTRLDAFEAGQHVPIGVDVEGRRVQRLFSIASAPDEPLEFLVVRVDGGVLSPRLDRLQAGGELWVRREPQGHFVLDRVEAAETAWMFATGAGLAPFVSMLRTEEPWKRFGRIVLVHGVRRRSDLAYGDELARHAREHDGRLLLVSCVTRQEPRDGMIAGRVTEALAGGGLEEAAGTRLEPEGSQVLLCGNPDMIKDMTGLLEKRGFRENGRTRPGNVTTERYW